MEFAESTAALHLLNSFENNLHKSRVKVATQVTFSHGTINLSFEFEGKLTFNELKELKENYIFQNQSLPGIESFLEKNMDIDKVDTSCTNVSPKKAEPMEVFMPDTMDLENSFLNSQQSSCVNIIVPDTMDLDNCSQNTLKDYPKQGHGMDSDISSNGKESESANVSEKDGEQNGKLVVSSSSNGKETETVNVSEKDGEQNGKLVVSSSTNGKQTETVNDSEKDGEQNGKLVVSSCTNVKQTETVNVSEEDGEQNGKLVVSVKDTDSIMSMDSDYSLPNGQETPKFDLSEKDKNSDCIESDVSFPNGEQTSKLHVSVKDKHTDCTDSDNTLGKGQEASKLDISMDCEDSMENFKVFAKSNKMYEVCPKCFHPLILFANKWNHVKLCQNFKTYATPNQSLRAENDPRLPKVYAQYSFTCEGSEMDSSFSQDDYNDADSEDSFTWSGKEILNN